MPKKETIKRMTVDDLEAFPKPVVDWAHVDALTDADIEKAIQNDPDAGPLLGPEFWAQARLMMPDTGRKPQITIKVNPHTLAWFKRQGKGYQSRMNAVLDAFVSQMESHA